MNKEIRAISIRCARLQKNTQCSFLVSKQVTMVRLLPVIVNLASTVGIGVRFYKTGNRLEAHCFAQARN